MTSRRKSPVLPIKIDATSNGEFLPIQPGDTVERAKQLAALRISEGARRAGQSRRRFISGLCGAATTLLTLNEAFAWRGNTGGRFDLPAAAGQDHAAAEQSLAGAEFIFDVQTHMVDNKGAWRNGPGRAMERFLARMPQGSCGEADPTDCFSAQHFIKEIFFDSDTNMAVLSFVPVPAEYNSLNLREADRVRGLVEALGGDRRLLLHAIVLPNLPPYQDQLDAMAAAVAAWPIAAFEIYTQWGPKMLGWALDDAKVGIPSLEQARKLGVRNICIHKGLPLRWLGDKFYDCADVGRAARLFPDLNFIIYHSGFVPRHREGPYAAAGALIGVDSLVKSLHDNNIGPNSNVYAELGSTWRFVMRDPSGAAHTLGKLLRYVGQDRLLWGTDSIWYGSPQDQIQGFRAFQISDELQDRHGYPKLTADLKAKVFGLNGAKAYGVDAPACRRKTETDPLQQLRADYRQQPLPDFATHGPKTRREFWQLYRESGGRT